MRKVIYLIFLILFAIQVNAIGISIPDGPKEYYFEPGLEISRGYALRNSMSIPLKARTFARGEFSEYVVFDKEVVDLGAGAMGGFTARIVFPEDMVHEPGVYRWVIGVVEERGGKEISVRSAVEDKVHIRVEYDGKYVSSSLSASNVNVGEDVKFGLSMNNYGKEDIDLVKGDIVVMDPKGEVVDSLKVPLVLSLDVRESKVIEAVMNTEGYKHGDYKAIAKLDYDGVSGESNVADFKIGVLEMDVLDYTDMAYAGQINEFEIEVESKWNNDIEEVYAVVSVDGRESFKTFEEDFKPWENKKLRGYFDTYGLSKGPHSINIELHYDDKITEKSGEVEILEKPKEEAAIQMGDNLLALGIIVVVLLVLNIFWFVYSKKDKK